MNLERILNNISLVMIMLLIWSCQPTDDAENEDLSRDTIATINKPIDTPLASNCYHHLVGTLGEQNIIAELKEEYRPGISEGRILKGYYLYEKYGGPIALRGQLNEDGKIELTEQGTWEGEAHKIIGTWDSSGQFVGEWVRGNNQNRYPVHLLQKETSHLQLICHQSEDTLLAFPDWDLSPEATFNAHWFKVESDNKTLAAFLNKEISKDFSFEGSSSKGASKNFVQLQKEVYFDEYRNEIIASIKDGLIDTTGTEEPIYGLNYALDLSMDVYYNSPEILTVGYTHYSYSGGAHGIYGTQVQSYNLSTYKKISLNDVFNEGYEKAVSEQLANAVRIKFELGENAPLSEILYEDAILPNENFGITNKGIFFVYTPYEIAPYAAGEIELFVSFDRIGEFVKWE